MKKILAVAGTATAAYTLLVPGAANAHPAPDRAAVTAVKPAATVKPMTAIGFQPLGSIQYSWQGVTVEVPTGCFLGHTIKGDGRKLAQEWTSWDCSPPASSFLAVNPNMCNPRYDFIYKDMNGKIYSRLSSGNRYLGCWGATGPTFTAPNNRTLPKYGSACAALYLNGQYKGQQCHNITP